MEFSIQFHDPRLVAEMLVIFVFIIQSSFKTTIIELTLLTPTWCGLLPNRQTYESKVKLERMSHERDSTYTCSVSSTVELAFQQNNPTSLTSSEGANRVNSSAQDLCPTGSSLHSSTEQWLGAREANSDAGVISVERSYSPIIDDR